MRPNNRPVGNTDCTRLEGVKKRIIVINYRLIFFVENKKAGSSFERISGKYVLVFCTAQYGNTKVKDMMGEGGVNGCEGGEMMKTQRTFEFFNTVIKRHGKLMMNVFFLF
jgi:hypothetical protein